MPISRAVYFLALVAATLAATAILLHVLTSGSPTPVRPVSCVQHALPDRGLPACDGGGYLALGSA